MKLKVDFDSLERIARSFSSSRSFDLAAEEIAPLEEIDIQLEGGGVEVNLSALEILDGLLTYKGRHVILYIKDHGRALDVAKADPSKGKKFHLADCSTLEDMRARNRFERYVVTRRTTGIFEISGMNSQGREETAEAALQVCMNCLRRLNYQSFLLQESRESRARIREKFELAGFFETYSTRFRALPAGYAALGGSAVYGEGWQALSLRLREQAGYTCEQCRVCLTSHPGLLHVHHVNGVKGDNRRDNLRVLCKDCHRKQPMHDHIFLAKDEMETLYQSRHSQGLISSSWESALGLADLSIGPALTLAQKRRWPAPEVGVPFNGATSGFLDAAWRSSRRAISQTLAPGRHGDWNVESPDTLLSELANGLT